MTAAAAAAAAKPAGRRYALLLALWDSDYARKAYGGYYNVFVSALGGSDDDGGEDRWDCFRVIGGEFPAAEDLASYDGFVVSGSPRDAHGDEPWVRRLCALLQTLHAMRKRVLGVCFGHQVLCRALGGRVGRARAGWDVGVRNVTFVQGHDLAAAGGLLPPFLADVDRLPRTASIIEVHQDEVWEIPPTATVLAYSEKTRVEAFAVGEHALGIQGHPEYTVDILHNLIDRLTDQNDIQRSVGEEARRTAADRPAGRTARSGPRSARPSSGDEATAAAAAQPPRRRRRRRHGWPRRPRRRGSRLLHRCSSGGPAGLPRQHQIAVGYVPYRCMNE